MASPLIARTHDLLTRLSLPRALFPRTPADLSAAASSLLVAAFEAAFATALAGVRRQPGGAADYAHNAQLVIDALAALLPPRVVVPAFVTGAAVGDGNLAATAFLVTILDEASRAVTAAASPLIAMAEADLASFAAAGSSARARDALAALPEAAGDAAAAAADEARALPAAAAADEAGSASWLAHAADAADAAAEPGAAAADIWSAQTPGKVRDKAAAAAARGASAAGRGAAAGSPRSASGPSLAETARKEMLASRAGAGGEGLLAADLKADDDRRRAESATQAARRAKGIMSRLAHNAAEELKQISAMTSAAVRAREVELRAMEARALAAATTRAKAAKFERKVLTMRTKLVVENLSRQTLSMRIARSSRQAAATASLLKALAGQARLGAADKLRAAAAERASMLVDANARVAWLSHTSKMLNEVMLEETARQVAQRQAATRSQKEALDRAISEMRLDEDALLARMKAEQAHAEEAFLATHVEPMADVGAGGDGAGRVAAARLADPTDTDNDAARVDTMARVHRTLAAGEARQKASRGKAEAMIAAIAGDVGGEVADAEGLTAQGAKMQVAAGLS